MKVWTFNEWLIEVERILVDDYGFLAPVNADPDTWKVYYEDDMIPEEAVAEDMSYV